MSHFLEFSGSDRRTVRANWHVALSERAQLEGPTAEGLPDSALPPPSANDAHAPWVVVCHGFKGFRAWGFFPWLCDQLAQAGFHALRIDFSHNGVEETDFDRLDLFAIDTPSRHQEDLQAVLAEVDRMCRADGAPAADAAGAAAPGPRIALVGHSRGGADALLCAARNPRVKAVVTLAATADLSRGFDLSEETLRRVGHIPVPNARTGQTMPVTRLFVDDSARHDVVAAARALAGRPLLLIHGSDDEAVPVEDAHRLAAAHGAAELLVIDHARHTFGGVHPFAGPTNALDTLADRMIAFLGRTLG